jgi:hypothetical protein
MLLHEIHLLQTQSVLNELHMRYDAIFRKAPITNARYHICKNHNHNPELKNEGRGHSSITMEETTRTPVANFSIYNWLMK